MGRKNQNTFIKKQKEAKKKKKREEKKAKMDERKNQPTSSKLEDMMAYLDDDGNIVSETPEEENVNTSKIDGDSKSAAKGRN